MKLYKNPIRTAKPPIKINTGAYPPQQLSEYIASQIGHDLGARELKLSDDYKKSLKPHLKKPDETQWVTEEDTHLMTEIQKRIQEQLNNGKTKIVVAVGGIRGASKTRIVDMALQKLKESKIPAAKLELDTQRKPAGEMTTGMLANPLNVKWGNVMQIIEDFRSGRKFTTSYYDYKPGKDVIQKEVGPKVKVLFIEGSHALSPWVVNSDLKIFAFVPPGIQTFLTALRDLKTSNKIWEKARMLNPKAEPRDVLVEDRLGLSPREKVFSDHFSMPSLPTADMVFIRGLRPKDAVKIYMAAAPKHRSYVKKLLENQGVTLPTPT